MYKSSTGTRISPCRAFTHSQPIVFCLFLYLFFIYFYFYYYSTDTLVPGPDPFQTYLFF